MEYLIDIEPKINERKKEWEWEREKNIDLIFVFLNYELNRIIFVSDNDTR